ncbi:hypothetical protein F4808DRAFT_453820 [Astrocystis sublimbata]|nr:hypothetical protein F4808DRAFT_453820 [Astrocystis sublimbata]
MKLAGTQNPDDPEALKHTVLLYAMESCIASARGWADICFIVPRQQGHLARSDILEIRLTQCPFVHSYVNFATPGQGFSGMLFEEGHSISLNDLLDEAAGAFVTEDADDNLFHKELADRLSIPMILPGTQLRRTIAILECGKSPATGLGIFTACRSLNLQVLALDKPGHWLSRPEYSTYRDAFIPINREPDEGLTNRIIDAISSYGRPIDGLITFFDPLMYSCAVAAARLGLPTASANAYEIAINKYKLRRFVGRNSHVVSSSQEATTLARKLDSPCHFPLIIKPWAGWGLEGVFRVDNEASLITAFESIDLKRHGNACVVESYCDGPEVDVNIVLCNGEVLFLEVSDDFPKFADYSARDSSSTHMHSFIEVANILPSVLPTHEQEVLQRDLVNVLRQLGFSDGFFHLEARVMKSTMQYAKGEDGFVDLQVSEPATADAESGSQEPAAWLIEINARPPGLQASWASRDTYGVDYWGLALSFAMGDKHTARALAAPFRSGAQHWCNIVFIPVGNGGIFRSDDCCQELIARRPDLARHVSRSICFFKKGDAVPEPSSGILTWAAYYLVTSRVSRRHVLETGETIRRETWFEIS